VVSQWFSEPACATQYELIVVNGESRTKDHWATDHRTRDHLAGFSLEKSPVTWLMQARRIVRSIRSSRPKQVGLCWCYWNFSHFFERTEFIINFFNVNFKISTMVPWRSFVRVVFCLSGLLSGVGIFSGLLSGGLLSRIVFCPYTVNGQTTTSAFHKVVYQQY